MLIRLALGVYVGELVCWIYTTILHMKQDTANISNLILDFGGVIYQIDHQRQIETFKKLGVSNFDRLYSQAMQSPLFAGFERGAVSPEELKQTMLRMLGNSAISMREIEDAWNSILIGFHRPTVELLEKLGEVYNLYLLSNTNIIHYNLYIKEFEDEYGYDFNSLFQESYWSFKIGMRKPDAEIFQFVLSNSNLNPEETIFVDDTYKNIEASRLAGLPAVYLAPGKQLSGLFDENLRMNLE